MTGPEFVEIFSEIIQTDEKINLDTLLKNIGEWDSMAMMAVIAYFDARYGISLDFGRLEELKTVKDLGWLIPDFKE